MKHKTLSLFACVLSVALGACSVRLYAPTGDDALRYTLDPAATTGKGTSPTAIDIGTAAIGTSIDKTIWLVNQGAGDVTTILPTSFSDTAFAYAGGSYPGTGGNCAVSLAAGASCSLVLRFSPTSGGQATGTTTLGFLYLNQSFTIQFSFLGTGTGALVVGGGNSAWALTTIAVTDALFIPPTDGCGQYLTNIQDFWKPTTFLYNGRVYFSIPCKYSDAGAGGWHTMFAHWAPGESVATIVDSNTGTASIDPTINKFSVAADTVASNDQKSLNWVQTTGNQLRGYGIMRASTGYPLAANDFASIGITSFVLGSADAFPSTVFRDLLYEGGKLYYYYWDSAGGNFVKVVPSSDFVTQESTPSTLLTGYSRPNVVVHGTDYYLIAFNHTTEHWERIKGSSPTNFDVSTATDLNLRSFRGGVGQWDYNYFQKVGGQGEPVVAGVRIIGSYVYVFYLAGAYTAGGSAAYSVPSAIGVLRAPLN